MIAQPTVLVKKKDGSQVRMTLSELREYKKKLKVIVTDKNTEKNQEKIDKKTEVQKVLDRKVPPKQAGQSVEVSVDTSLKKEDKKQQESSVSPTDIGVAQNEPHELARTTPVKNIFIDEAIASQSALGGKKWTDDDHKSPLEGDDKDVVKYEAESKLPDQKHDLFSRVVKELGFVVPDELQPRLRSLVLSHVKGVRTVDQVKDCTKKDIAKGGLGFDERQVEAFLKIIQATSRNLSKNKERGGAKPKSVHVVENIVKSGLSLQNNLPNQKKRTTMHDVKVLEKTNESEEEVGSLGPIEELEKMTVEDFRRLSDDPVYGAEELLKKFTALKEESYPLFLKGLKAWYNSPLYLDYQNILSQTINQSIELRQFFSNRKDGLNNDEFISILEVMKNI